MTRDNACPGSVPLHDPMAAWRIYRAALGDTADSYLRLAREFDAAGHYGDATQVLDHAMKLFPMDAQASIERAQMAIDAKNWLEATALYADIRDKFPAQQAGYLYGGWSLWASGQFGDADRVLRDGIVRYSAEPWLLIHYAWSALNRKDWAEAARRFDVLRTNFPEEWIGYVDGGWALREAGQLIDADAVLKEAVEKFPDQLSAWFHYGRNAVQLGELTEAVRRWKACLERHPDDVESTLELQKAIYQIRLREMSEDDNISSEILPSKENVKTEQQNSASEIEILSHFETLGDNCEMGFVQRKFGYEPLSLLRWASASIPSLIAALESQFDGVGMEENTILSYFPDRELVVSDTRYFHSMHTHSYEKDIPNLDAYRAQICKNLIFMKRRLISVLKSSEKIFVYRRYLKLSDNEILDLSDSLRKYGSNRLLCVRPSSNDDVDGSVQLMSPHIAVSYLKITDQVALEPIDHTGWITICRKAMVLLSVDKANSVV